MFGCGLYNETDIFNYLDKINNNIDITRHLETCKICLDEITELNRINFIMGSRNPVLPVGSAFVSVIFNSARIESASGTISGLKFISSASTRQKQAAGKHVQFKMLDAEIKIIPDGNGLLSLNISAPIIINTAVELYKNPENIPLYSKKSSSPEIRIKGLDYGEYLLKIADKSIKIIIKRE